MEEKQYSELDLKVAKEMGSIDARLDNIEHMLTAVMADHSKKIDAMWDRIDSNKSKINRIIGVGIGIQIVWGVALALMGILK